MIFFTTNKSVDYIYIFFFYEILVQFMMRIVKSIMPTGIAITVVTMLNVIGMVWIAKENRLKSQKAQCV